MKYVQPYGISDVDAAYINGNPATGVQGSIPPAAAIEHPLRELANLIKAAGITPSATDLQQLARGVRQALNYLVATQIGGNPNTLTSANTGDVPTLTALPAGLRLFVHIPANNTGATTLVIDGLSAVEIVRANGASLSADDLRGGMIAALVSDGTKLQIENFQGFTSSTTNNNTYTVNIPYIADTGTVNAVAAVFSPAITSQTAGLIVCVKLGATFTGPATITVNALATKPIVRLDNTPIQRNDAFIGEMLLLAYDGTSYQVVNQTGLPETKLVANANWYVNTGTGHDTNYDGTAATVSGAHGPFKTVQRGADETAKYNMNNYSQTVHIAAGAYSERVICPRQNGNGSVTFDGGSYATTGITGPTGESAFWIQQPGVWGVTNLTLAAGTGASVGGDPQDCLSISGSGTIVLLSYLAFGNAVRAQIAVEKNANVQFSNTWVVSGSAQAHMMVFTNATASVPVPIPASWPAVSVSTPVSFSVGFCWVAYGGFLTYTYASLSSGGSVGGPKYNVQTNGNLSVLGQGTSYLPGGSPGVTGTGGQYS